MKLKTILFLLLQLCFLFPKAQVFIVKGPYLQIGTATSMIVKWETNVACDSKVEYGTNATSLNASVTSSLSTLTHELQISGLNPYTKYFYNVGTSTLVIQGDTNNYFVTSPMPGTAGKYRFWVTGDCGNASANQINVRDQYLNYNTGKRTDGWILLGDNAYFYGSHADYNAEFFGIYQNSIMKKAVLWPAPGNHDYDNGATTTPTVPYYDIFTTPSSAQAGGIASGTEAYYSFNYGNIHFISLDSYGTTGASQKMYDTLGAQAVWLKQDLAANNKQWTIAYWHHPPYTMGSHNSDTENDLVTIRQNFIRILERYHVDLIMCGHSHDYERSKLMKGHYGNEASFSSTLHVLDTSTARYDGSVNSCPYLKDTTNKKAGTVYVVAGSAGYLGGQQASFPHDAMYYSNASDGGSLVLDIEQNKLEARWLCADGLIRDKFTIFKHVNRVTSYTVNPGQAVTLSASWPGNYTWSNSFSVNPVTINTFSNADYWVKDNFNCVADTFHIKVLPAVNFTANGIYCAGQSLQFSDNSTNNPINWQWTISPSVAVTINNPNNQNPQINFGTATIYTVSLVAGNIYGQGSVFNQTLIVHPKPFVLYNGGNQTICIGETTTLTATGSPNYIWSTGQAGFNVVVTPSLTTVYSTTFVSLQGCTNTGSISVTVDACLGLNPHYLQDKGYELYPNPAQDNLTIRFNESGEYTVVISDVFGTEKCRVILLQQINNLALRLESGLYYYQILKSNAVIGSGKLLKN